MECNCPQGGCLCDVVVREQTPIANIDFAKDSLFAREICEHLGLGYPFTVDDALAFFTMQCRVKDTMAATANEYTPASTFQDGRVNPRVAKAKVTTEVRSFISMMLSRGATNSQIRAEVEARFGFVMSSQYLSTLKKRMDGSRQAMRGVL